MKAFFKRAIALVAALYWDFHEWRHMEAIAARWRLWGHPTPYAAAMEELDLRARLESFRDYASERYLNERVSLEQIRQDWIDMMKPQARIPGGIQDVSVLRSVIGDMPAMEMLHRDAYAAWKQDCAIRTRRAFVPPRAGLSALHRRVLRA